MKKIIILNLLFLISCGADKKTALVKVDRELTPYSYNMAISTNQAQYTHIATINPSIVNGQKIQATSMAQNGNIVYLSSNTQGETVRGGLDIVNISTVGTPTVVASLVSATTEYADIKYKDGYVFMVGQKANNDKNDAVLTVVKVSTPTSPSVASELVFADGYYATSIDIEGNLAYITIPNVGLKVVNITNPAAVTLSSTENLVGPLAIPSSGGSATTSIPPTVTITHGITSDWLLGYGYNVEIKNNGSLISDWTLCFDYNHAVGNSGFFNATLDSSSAKPHWKVTPASYNHLIYPGSNVTLGWNALPGNVDGEKISNIRLFLQADASCEGDTNTYLTSLTNSLFVKRYNSKSLVLGGGSSHKLISYANNQIALVKDISTTAQEAPSRFVLKGNVAYTNGGSTGLTIINNLNTTPVISYQGAIAGTGNGISVDSCSNLYLAQGEVGLQVVNAASLTAPESLGTFDYADDAGSANNVFSTTISSSNYVFVADGLGGIKIIKVQTSTACTP